LRNLESDFVCLFDVYGIYIFFPRARNKLGENCSRAFVWQKNQLLIFIYKKNLSLRLENVLVCDLYFSKFAVSAIPIRMLSLDAEGRDCNVHSLFPINLVI
jgi:hypothetical protein